MTVHELIQKLEKMDGNLPVKRLDYYILDGEAISRYREITWVNTIYDCYNHFADFVCII